VGEVNGIGQGEGRGEILLRLARRALEEVLDAATPEPEGTDPKEAATEGWLEEQGATFVTLTLDGKLRGCIGSLEPKRSLLEDVRRNARAAAFDDPRFAPLTVEELPEVTIEVSLLSPTEPIEVESEEDLLAALRPGVDGVVLESGFHRGTFLPQVWEQLPQAEDFVKHLKRKADLDADFWSPDMRVSRYTVTKWKEKGVRA